MEGRDVNVEIDGWLRWMDEIWSVWLGVRVFGSLAALGSRIE